MHYLTIILIAAVVLLLAKFVFHVNIKRLIELIINIILGIIILIVFIIF